MRRFDLAMAALFALLLQVEIWFTRLQMFSGRLASAVLALLVAGSLAFRRSNPLTAYLVNTSALVVGLRFLSDAAVWQWLVINLIGMYSVAAYGTKRQGWISLSAAVGMFVFFFASYSQPDGIVAVAGAVAAWLAAWLAGRLYGGRVRELELIKQRDATAMALADEQIKLVVEEERNRLSREVHDHLGHVLNVIVMHAGAGRLAVGENPAKVRHVLNTIEDTGRLAMDELDSLLGQVDVEGRIDDKPVPGIGDLDALTTRISTAGLTVSLEVDGEASSVPPSVGFAVYRVVQEAMTNTMRHADASRAQISVNITKDSVDISVIDDGHDAGDIVPGRGLIGARERLALHGGNLEWRQKAGGLVLEGHIPLPVGHD